MDRIINPGTSIQTTINLSSNGDRILLNPGTYNNDNTLTINKSITIRANVAGTYPNVKLNATTYTYMLNFAANNIILDGLDIDNIRGGGQGKGYIHNTTTLSNLIIQNSKIHDFRRIFIGDTSLVNGLTVLNSRFYKNQYTTFEIDNGKNIVIKYNQFYDQMTGSVKGEAPITWYVGSDVGISEIFYNYIYGHRVGIEISSSVASGIIIGSIDIAHNTIDMYLMATYPPSIQNPYCLVYGISFWANPGMMFDGSKVHIRDNIISRGLAYAIYGSPTKFLTNPLILVNNLFYDNYWYYWPSYRNPQEWYGNDSRAQIGWGDATDKITPVNCITAQNPLFAKTGIDAPSFYSLLPGSPALYSASDGLNIGAWQNGIKSDRQLVSAYSTGKNKVLSAPQIKPRGTLWQ